MTVTILQRNNGGFSLIEVMMAVLILMVGMLGLLQSINIALEVNLRNQLRDEAVHIGQRVMSDMRGKGFDNISVATTPTDSYNYAPVSMPSKVRGVFKMYSVNRSSKVLSIQDAKPVTKQLEVIVKWKYRGVGYENRVFSPISILR